MAYKASHASRRGPTALVGVGIEETFRPTCFLLLDSRRALAIRADRNVHQCKEDPWARTAPPPAQAQRMGQDSQDLTPGTHFDFFGHSPGGRRTRPPGLFPGGYCRNSGTWGSTDAVKVGPPPVGPPRRRSRPRFKTGRWAPHLPHHDQTSTASTTTAKDRGTPRGPPQPGRRRGGPGDPGARQEARLTPGS